MIMFSNQMNDSGAVVRQYFYMLFLSIYMEEKKTKSKMCLSVLNWD
jgi:hypothetical protein